MIQDEFYYSSSISNSNFKFTLKVNPFPNFTFWTVVDLTFKWPRAWKPISKCFTAFNRHFSTACSQHFCKRLWARYSGQKSKKRDFFEISIDIFLSLRLLSRMNRREFDVIVTFNVSSIVSIDHLLIISHRAHLSQTLNHVHRHVSCVLFKTTRYFKTRFQNNLLQQNIAIFVKNLYTGKSFSKTRKQSYDLLCPLTIS